MDYLLNIEGTFPPHYAKIVMDREYDRYLGLHHHQEDSDPLSIVSHHAGEDADTRSLRSLYARRYIKSGVHRLFGLTYTEFLELPIYEAHELLRFTQYGNELRAQTLEDLEEQLQDHGGG